MQAKARCKPRRLLQCALMLLFGGEWDGVLLHRHLYFGAPLGFVFFIPCSVDIGESRCSYYLQAFVLDVSKHLFHDSFALSVSGVSWKIGPLSQNFFTLFLVKLLQRCEKVHHRSKPVMMIKNIRRFQSAVMPDTVSKDGKTYIIPDKWK